MTSEFNVVLLHDKMVDKQGDIVTTSLTLIDVHDLARSCRTYGVENLFISHSAPTIRKLTRTIQSFWEDGFGATYNPNRKEALDHVICVSELDEAIHNIALRTGKTPILVATSAKPGGKRISFKEMQELYKDTDVPFLMMLGTGWGMSQELLDRADYFLDPINGPTNYNHLSVRSACAIMLDRLFGV